MENFNFCAVVVALCIERIIKCSLSEKKRNATDFKYLRVNDWETDQVTSKCQTKHFFDKTYMSEMEKVNSTTELCIFELAYKHSQKF